MFLFTAIISFTIGGVFGVALMCLLQCHRIDEPKENDRGEDVRL